MIVRRSLAPFLFALFLFNSHCFPIEKPIGYSLRIASAYAVHGDLNERFQSGPSLVGGADIDQNNRLELELSHLFFDVGIDTLHQAYRYYTLSLRWIRAFKDGKLGLGYTISPATYYAFDVSSLQYGRIQKESIGLVGVDFLLATRMGLSAMTLFGRMFTTDTKTHESDWINYFAEARLDRTVNKIVTANCALQYWQYKNLISKYYPQYYYSNVEIGRDYYGSYRARFFLIPSIELKWNKSLLQAGPVFNLFHYSEIEDKVSWQGSICYVW